MIDVVVRKLTGKAVYVVKDKSTGAVYSYHVTKASALAQVRVMQSMSL